MKRPGSAAAVGRYGATGEGEAQARALSALAGLGQVTRLEVFRLLVRCEPDGLAAGAIAAAVGCPQNTLSAHIAVLARAGLVRGMRRGRSIIYRAEIGGVRELVAFLVEACCDGHPELCGLFGVAPESNRRCTASAAALAGHR